MKRKSALIGVVGTFEFQMTWDGENRPNFVVKNGHFVGDNYACSMVVALEAVSAKILEEVALLKSEHAGR